MLYMETMVIIGRVFCRVFYRVFLWTRNETLTTCFLKR